MRGHPTCDALSLESLAGCERDRLVRLCAYLSQDAQVAEDLAQETLLEAFRHEGSLRDPAARRQWLWGIARNVCRRWRCAHGRETSAIHFMLADELEATLAECGIAESDLDAELEHAELSNLLHRSVALLPPDTRTAIVGRYIEGRTDSDIAGQLGLSEIGLRVKLHRGRQLLRRVISEDLRGEIGPWGATIPAPDEWQQSRIWCPNCGSARLVGRLAGGLGDFALRCTACCAHPEVNISQAASTEILGNATGFKVALSRVSRWAYGHYRHALLTGVLTCGKCGHLNPVHVGQPATLPPVGGIDRHSIYAICDRCGTLSLNTLPNFTLALQEVRSFWQTHRRIRMAPAQEIELDGRPGLLVRVESVRTGVALEVIWASDTYEVLRAYRA